MCGAAGSAVETVSALHRVDKQLMAAQGDDPWGTGPVMRDWPAVQEERRRCAARPCYWSSNAGPACGAGGEAGLCCSPLWIWSDDAGLSYPAVQVKRRRCAARRCLNGPAMQDRSALQLKRRHCSPRHCKALLHCLCRSGPRRRTSRGSSISRRASPPVYYSGLNEPSLNP